jgi:glutamyl-tRNA reductase
VQIGVICIFNDKLLPQEIILLNQLVEDITSDDPQVIGLSTCHRHEFYFSSADLEDKYRSILKSILTLLNRSSIDYQSYFQIDCFYHLTIVMAGLNSPILGETHILNQVKKAYENSLKQHKRPAVLHYLFQKSLKLAKFFRSQRQDLFGNESLEKKVIEYVLQHAKIDDPILLVGNSSVNRALLSRLINLHYKKIFLASRGDIKNENQSVASYLNFDALKNITQFKVVIFATFSQDLLVNEIKHSENLKLMIDLSIPKVTERKLICQSIAYYDLNLLTLEIQSKQQHLQLTKEEENVKILKQVERQISLYYLRQLKKRQLLKR